MPLRPLPAFLLAFCAAGSFVVSAPRPLLADEPASSDAARGAYAAAAALQNREAWDLAAEEWAGLLTAHPNDPLALKGRYYLAICLAKEGRWPDAARTLREVVASKADAATIAAARWELGRGSFEAARAAPAPEAYAAAAAALDDFVKRAAGHPQEADGLHLLGESLWQAGKRDQALAAWQRFVAEHGDAARLPEVLYALGVGQTEAGQPAAALETFARFLASFADHPLAADVSLWRADAAAAADQPQVAVAALTALAGGEGPRAGDALERLAALHDRRQEWPEAAAAYVALAKRLGDTPRTADVVIAAARALVKAGRLDDARPLLERIAAAPGAAGCDASHRLAQLELDAGRAERALAVADAGLAKAERLADLDPELQQRLGVDRGEALLALDRPADAAAVFHDLAARHPTAARRADWQLREAAASAAGRRWAEVHAALVAAIPGLEGPDRAEAMLLDATALVELKQPAEAADLLAGLDREVPDWPRRDEARLLAVRALREKGDKAAALAVAERLVADAPQGTNADVAWYRLGQLRQDAGRTDDAIAAFAQALETDPRGPRAAWSLLATGWCHEAAGRLPEAAAAWGRLIDDYPDSTALPAALVARADTLQRQGDFAGGLATARRLFAVAKQGRPQVDEATIAEARLVEGLCLAGTGSHAQAAAAFRRLLEDRPEFPAAPRVLFELGAALVADGKDEDAGRAFTLLVERYPQSDFTAEAWLEIGELRFAAQDWPAADAAYTAAVAAARTRTDGGADLVEQARHKLGWTHVMRGDQAAAARVFEEQLAAAADGPLAPDAQALLGEALLALDRPADASRALAAALADPQRISSAELRGAAFVRAAESAAARKEWAESLAIADRFRSLEPDSPQARQGRYAAAWALQNLGRLDDAIAAYREIAEGRTELSARARLMEGEALFEKGDHKEAIKAFFKVAYGFGERDAPAAFHPWQAQATYEAARCFEVLGKPDQARKLYAELVERYSESQQSPAARKRLDALGGPPGDAGS